MARGKDSQLRGYETGERRNGFNECFATYDTKTIAYGKAGEDRYTPHHCRHMRGVGP